VIKPSGGELTVALVTGDRILIEPKEMEPRVYQYELGAKPHAELMPQQADLPQLRLKLESFLQTATKSLMDNTAGVVDNKPH